ncbi:MAG: hypothetical protein SPF31_02125 [Lactobacillus delbrueckii]|nr:hypothetical protein [Lactobacillus delbrueckii]MDY5602547.1 hypothetical protein [Lactobacillus delbrueckii]
MIKQQLIRLSKRWQGWLALAIGFAIIFLQARTISSANAHFINSAYVHLTGFDYTGLGSRSYYVILPLTAALSAGSTIAEDKKQHFREMQLSRFPLNKYFASCSASSFIFAGLIAILPLICEGIFFFSQYSLAPLSRKYELTPINPGGWSADLFYTHPIVFWLLGLLIVFIFAGLLSQLSLIASAFGLRNGLEVIVPFAITLTSSILRDFSGFEPLSIPSIITPTFSNEYPFTVFGLIVYPILIIAIVWGSFLIKERNDVLD